MDEKLIPEELMSWNSLIGDAKAEMRYSIFPSNCSLLSIPNIFYFYNYWIYPF
jgi:hypothetical protein